MRARVQGPSSSPTQDDPSPRSATAPTVYQVGEPAGPSRLDWPGKSPLRRVRQQEATLRTLFSGEDDIPPNEIFLGDNLRVMAHLLGRFRGRIKLAYLDPPFDSGTNYSRVVRLRGPVADRGATSFEHHQYDDVWSAEAYLQFMYERIVVLRELLCDAGSIFLQCDQHRSHHLRCILDEVFGEDSFVNEIIWQRARTVKGNSGQGEIGLGSNVDSILHYAKHRSAATFRTPFVPYSEEYVAKFFRYADDDGRRYRLSSMTGPRGAAKGNPSYEVMGVRRHWRYSEAKMRALLDAGLVVQRRPGNVPQRKQYLDDGEGVALQSLWTDIPGLGSRSSERTGYPTQKPQALLSRIVRMCTDPGDVIFDPFMGSGTTQVAALTQGRRFLGCDKNPASIHACTARSVHAMSACEGGPALAVFDLVGEEDSARCTGRASIEAGRLTVEAFDSPAVRARTGGDFSPPDWRRVTDAVLIDPRYDGQSFRPTIIDMPTEHEVVRGAYELPDDASAVRLRLVDLMGHAWTADVRATP